MAISVDTFKTFLKTHLFSRAFHYKLGLLNTYTQLCNSILFLVRFFDIIHNTHDVILIYHLVIFILGIVVMRS